MGLGGPLQLAPQGAGAGEPSRKLPPRCCFAYIWAFLSLHCVQSRAHAVSRMGTQSQEQTHTGVEPARRAATDWRHPRG